MCVNPTHTNGVRFRVLFRVDLRACVKMISCHAVMVYHELVNGQPQALQVVASVASQPTPDDAALVWDPSC